MKGLEHAHPPPGTDLLDTKKLARRIEIRSHHRHVGLQQLHLKPEPLRTLASVTSNCVVRARNWIKNAGAGDPTMSP